MIVIEDIPLEILLEDVCRALEVPVDKVLSSSRKREHAWPRHIFCYVAFFYTKHTITSISSLVGARDHTTAGHSRDTVATYIEKNDGEFMLVWEKYKEASICFKQLKIIRISRSNKI